MEATTCNIRYSNFTQNFVGLCQDCGATLGFLTSSKFHNFFTIVVMLINVTLCKNKYLSVIRIVKLSSRNSVVFIKLKVGKQWIMIPLLSSKTREKQRGVTLDCCSRRNGSF